jgi:hypothetical protein
VSRPPLRQQPRDVTQPLAPNRRRRTPTQTPPPKPPHQEEVLSSAGFVEGLHYLSCGEDPTSLAQLIDFWVGREAPAWARGRLARMSALAVQAAASGETPAVARWLTETVRRDGAGPAAVSPPWVLSATGTAVRPLGPPECAASPTALRPPSPGAVGGGRLRAFVWAGWGRFSISRTGISVTSRPPALPPVWAQLYQE